MLFLPNTSLQKGNVVLYLSNAMLQKGNVVLFLPNTSLQKGNVVLFLPKTSLQKGNVMMFLPNTSLQKGNTWLHLPNVGFYYPNNFKHSSFLVKKRCGKFQLLSMNAACFISFIMNFNFFTALFNKIIKIKMYIRTIFRKLCKAFSNIQRLKHRNIPLKGYVLRI